MKDAFYFSHDANARNDQKILALRSVYGMEGYGRYWVLVEMLREETEYRLMLTKYIWNAIAMQLQCTPDAAQAFVEDCIHEFHLFESDGKYFWSPSLQRRMVLFEDKKESARKAARARWDKERKASEEAAENAFDATAHAEEMQPDTCVDATAMQTHSAASQPDMQCNAIKVNNIILNNNKLDSKESARACESPSEVTDPESEGQAPSDPDTLKALEVYSLVQKEFGPIKGGTEAEVINDWIVSFPREWIIQAIRLSVANQARNSRYADKILRSWRQKGFSESDKPWESEANGGNREQRRFGRDKPNAGIPGSRPSQTDWSNEPDHL